MDSSASDKYYSVGVNGNVFLKYPQSINSESNFLNSVNTKMSNFTEVIQPNNEQFIYNQKLSLLKFETPDSKKMLEILISELTPNLLLYQAHR